MKQLSILPVFIIPNDVKISDDELENAKELLEKHVTLAKQHYKKLLNDTFLTSSPETYSAKHEDKYYTEIPGETDSAHRITKDLFEWKNENRNNSNHVFLTLFVRKNKYEPSKTLFGGGRTFNGAPNTGGGYIELEYTSLLQDYPFPFQSTLVHELGHAFGLVHASCYGYNDSTNSSIMSLNPAYHSNGLVQSKKPGNFNPEEYYTLSLNTRAFPKFKFNALKHNPDGKKLVVSGCFLGAMSEYIGK